MKHTEIKLSNLKDVSACYEAVESIEADYRNYQGGITAWNSGRETHLLAGAKAKIKAINAKASKFPCEEDEE